MASQFLALTIGERIDSIIKAVNGESAFVWFVAIAVIFGYVIKQFMSYMKNNSDDKESVLINLDEKAFQKAALPLLLQLDAQVAQIVSVELEEGMAGDELIAKYEEERRKAIGEIDISESNEALNLNDALRVSAKANFHKSEYKRTYKQVRSYLKILVWTLGTNLFAGICVFIAVNGFSDRNYDRPVFVIWAILMLFNIIIGVLYAAKRTKLDTMKEFEL